MALVQIAAETAPARPSDVPDRLRGVLDAMPAGAPLAVLIHGFKFRPGDPARDPHVQLFGADPRARRCADWPAGLGFSAEDPADGLCLGFGWDAAAPRRPSRRGFARAYARAPEAGARLADLLAALHARRPDLRADLFAQSLGARVALAALHAPGVRRALLLGAAEDAGAARATLDAGPPGPEVIHVAARHNDLFDLMFEAAAPRGPDGRRARALGREGLPGRPDWIDLQLDAPALAAWLEGRGLALAPTSPAVCHWSFYARPGAMALYRAMLRDPAALWSPAGLRAACIPEGLAPRWSRLAPRPPRWAGRLGGGWRGAPAPQGGAGMQAA